MQCEPRTVFLAMDTFDRYTVSQFEAHALDRAFSELIKVGMASLFLATKYQEGRGMDAETLASVTEWPVTKQDLLACEARVFETLKYSLDRKLEWDVLVSSAGMSVEDGSWQAKLIKKPTATA